MTSNKIMVKVNKQNKYIIYDLQIKQNVKLSFFLLNASKTILLSMYSVMFYLPSRIYYTSINFVNHIKIREKHNPKRLL